MTHWVVVIATAALVWAYFRWRSNSRTRAPQKRTRTPGCNLGIVGESNYQAALKKIAGRGDVRHSCYADLVLEDDNRHDSNAVRVDIEGRTVGYLSREHALAYRQQIGQESTCAAVIVGGDGRSLGVWIACKLR